MKAAIEAQNASAAAVQSNSDYIVASPLRCFSSCQTHVECRWPLLACWGALQCQSLLQRNGSVRQCSASAYMMSAFGQALPGLEV